MENLVWIMDPAEILAVMLLLLGIVRELLEIWKLKRKQ